MNIKELRKNKGLTQIEVAKNVGVSLVSYQLWERGVSKPKPENLEKLKNILKQK
jgi:transcriptional regulator with XRE-family HTH domain